MASVGKVGQMDETYERGGGGAGGAEAAAPSTASVAVASVSPSESASTSAPALAPAFAAVEYSERTATEEPPVTFLAVEPKSNPRPWNEQFRDEMFAIISTTDDHPLAFLLVNGQWGTEHDVEWDDETGEEWDFRVDAGHFDARVKGTLDERLALEDMSRNRHWGSYERADSPAVPPPREFIDIHGVPVERVTAEDWVRAGRLDASLVASAPVCEGWAPPGGRK